MGDLLPIRRYCEVKGIDRKTVKKYIAEGKITPIQIYRYKFIDIDTPLVITPVGWPKGKKRKKGDDLSLLGG